MKILTFGVFDYFHIGHLRLFVNCKKHADYLIVAVQKTEYIHKNKPEAKLLYTLQERVEILSALKVVDEVVPYSNVEDAIKEIDFDILAIGGDQNNNSIMQAIAWCEKNNKRIVVIERTPNICSSSIKDGILAD